MLPYADIDVVAPLSSEALGNPSKNAFNTMFNDTLAKLKVNAKLTPGFSRVQLAVSKQTVCLKYEITTWM